MPHPVFDTARTGSKSLVGGWLSFGDPLILETMLAAPFDYIGVDTQHTLMSVEDAARLLVGRALGGKPVLVRTPDESAAGIGKVLDAGGDGVIVPMVNSGETARAVVAACQYSPRGVRSFGPMRSGMPFDVEGLSARIASFVMVETPEAVSRIDEICATPGLTGVYVGPADLAIGLGLPVGAPEMPQALKSALVTVAESCARHGVLAAGHFPVGHAAELQALGFRMFTVGADRRYLAVGAAADVRAARAALDGAI